MIGKKLYLLLAVFVALAVFFHSRLPDFNIYPPLLSRTYPLTTPMAFWSSALGMRRLAGGILWIQAMQYYGGRPEDEDIPAEYTKDLYRRDPERVKTLYPQLKNYWQQIIRIDPYMASAYLSGPTTVGWNLRRYGEALDILTEGIQAVESIIRRQENLEIEDVTVPHPLLMGREPFLKELRDRLYLLKTVIVFLQQDKYSEAIPYLERIASKEDTPEEVSIMLAQIYSRRGLYEKAFNLWVDLYETTSKKSTRRLALDYLQQIKKEVVPSD